MALPESYEQAVAEHEWSVPERYNIAADVCDKHDPDKLAMVWERFDGERGSDDSGEDECGCLHAMNQMT